jgi:hypothetical protein
MNETTVVLPMKYLQFNDNMYKKSNGDSDGVSINVEIARDELEAAISSFVETFEETG